MNTSGTWRTNRTSTPKKKKKEKKERSQMTKGTAGSILRVLKPPEPATGDIFFEAGGSTFHTHTCPTDPPHTWKCNSPYCNFLHDLCPDHGGAEPVTIGREPWKR